MSISLYDITVGTYRQVLGATAGFLEKGKQHCEQQGISLDDLVDYQLAKDMLPFRFQVLSVVHHSIDVLDSLEAGVFGPPSGPMDQSYTQLQRMVEDSLAALDEWTPEQVNPFEGKDMAFQMNDIKIPFTAEAFVLSFSHPNLFFHAATAYDVLRLKGAPLGKIDFLGQMRVKQQ